MTHKLDDKTMAHIKKVLASPEVEKLLRGSSKGHDPGPNVCTYVRDGLSDIARAQKARATAKKSGAEHWICERCGFPIISNVGCCNVCVTGGSQRLKL